ncbi:type IV secretion system protein VirB10 [Brevundimonas sp.]|uniref:type IV secretion system protein VirB10 n=2 Tax=Brevundimonas sp. TaxID=1871086 RepID=UPI0027FC5D13|nr:type IV secretion system protein VirB10 [Brevundimonas sp.]MDQ7813195.1 type IV secretion system protein VirB10 [Brevundimonas sp.]
MTHEHPSPSEPPAGADRPEPVRDRGVSPIAGRLGGRHGKMTALAALALGCGVFLFATWDRGDAGRRDPASADEPVRPSTPFEPARRPADPPLLSEAASDPSAPLLIDEANRIPALDAARTPHPVPKGGPSPADQRQALAESARRAPVLAYSRPGAAASMAPDRPAGVAAPADSPAAAPTSLDQLRRVSPIARTRADRLPDRNLLLTAGTSVPCVLQTAMDSATPGYVSCVLPSDVWSDNGAVVLMERGSRVLGEYRGGLEPGRGRLFVLWTRAVTPGGVAVSLASPAADALGRAGFDGAVDRHFWDRFGGALLLSIVDDGVHAAIGQSRDVQSTARVPSDAAAVALQNSVGIPPTLRKAQGAEVSIFVAQDLDFSGVYRLRAR